MKRLFLLLPALALASCAITPEQRVNAALQQAGVPPRIAGCMARRMAARLSIGQLKELKRLGSLAEQHAPGEKVTVRQVIHKAEALGDPEIVSVTSHAALRCYLAG